MNGSVINPGSNEENASSVGTQQQKAAAASTHKPAPNSHWTLMVVFFSLLVDLLGFTVILPLIPSMLEYYSKKDQVISSLKAARSLLHVTCTSQKCSIKRSDWSRQNLDVRHKSLMLMSPDPFPSLGLVRVAATPDYGYARLTMYTSWVYNLSGPWTNLLCEVHHSHRTLRFSSLSW